MGSIVIVLHDEDGEHYHLKKPFHSKWEMLRGFFSLWWTLRRAW